MVNKDEFFKEFPSEAPKSYGCCVDGLDYETCVYDEGDINISDCSIAESGVKKLECEHWKAKTGQAFYTPEEIWEWLKDQ